MIWGTEKTMEAQKMTKHFTAKFIGHGCINEDYRGKKFCYTYGMSAFAYSRKALVKKNVCTREQSYLMFTDARTFTPINHAYLPHNIP